MGASVHKGTVVVLAGASACVVLHLWVGAAAVTAARLGVYICLRLTCVLQCRLLCSLYGHVWSRLWVLLVAVLACLSVDSTLGGGT